MLRESAAYRSTFDHATRNAEVAAFMWRTYWWMSLGLALTGIVAWVVSSTPEMVNLIVGNQILFFGLILGELGMVVAFSSMAHRVSAGTAAAMFLGYAALNGLTFSVLFLAYTQESIAQTFFVTAGSFAGLSLAGYTTKRDLSGMRGFLMIGVIGIVLASLVNMFFNNPAIYWITTYAGVLVFAGLTAYDTQKLKRMYAVSGDAGNLALRGALTLYLDFINLMIFLLRLMGRRR